MCVDWGGHILAAALAPVPYMYTAVEASTVWLTCPLSALYF